MLNNPPAAPARPYEPTGEHGILNAMPSPVLVVDGDSRILFVNPAVEQAFASSRNSLIGRPLARFVTFDCTLLDLLRQCRAMGKSISEYDVTLALQRGIEHLVDIHVAPMSDDVVASMLVVLHPCSMARRLDQQLSHRGAARSVAGLAAMLAHEVKNPLSGIRGAAQLLEDNLDEEDRPLSRLICEETDRICALVDRMEQFSDVRSMAREPINIHRVLERVRLIAENGFGRHLVIRERYDPSLPEVDGNRDKLIQLFLNLVKNAAEAAAGEGGTMILSTHYQHGLRIGVGNSRERLDLPITVAVADNGPGIDDDIAADLFDPFITNKSGGSGLGLSLVAKIAGDHGGVVEFETGPDGSIFRVRLPACRRMALAT